VGTDHDTAAFAVESVRRWWHGRGRADYPGARRLLITADAGGWACQMACVQDRSSGEGVHR
jgi:hypothetical protein